MDGEELSLRKPNELLAMEFDDSDYYLKNGILTKGNPLVIVGPSGAGKTTLALQLVACIITGKDFLNMPVHQQDMKWLFIQNENSNRRLQYELAKLKGWLNADEWQAVDDNITLSVLEKDNDYYLSLKDPFNVDLLAGAVRKVKAGGVVFDPLSAFAPGSLNTDTAMLSTLRSLASLARDGDPTASPVIIHHTLNGRAGMKKATGYDRGSYGRGSDALHGWTRGQINLAPVYPDHNDSLIIACGKNSNASEFKTFGVTRNPSTRVYEVDGNIDVAAWEESATGSSRAMAPLVPPHRPTVETITQFVAGLPVTKGELVAAIMEEYGCKKSRAYEVIAAAEAARKILRNQRGLYVVPDPASPAAGQNPS